MIQRLKGFNSTCREYAEEQQILDQTLYGLCRKNPGHSDWGAVAAKVWIIGRTYATGIERKIRSKRTQGSSLTQLTEHILANRVRVESIFSRLERLSGLLTLEKLKQIVIQHGKFMRLLQPKLRRKQSPRSFVSKYMHFHCPLVPLYDTLAVKALQHLYRWQDSFEVFDLPPEADEEYGWHVMRFWQLHQDAQQNGRRVTVKLLDYYLLRVAEKLRKQRVSPL